MAYAGLDVGTSGCKLVVYDLDGNELFRAARHYKERGGDGLRELDGELVAGNVLDMLQEAGRLCPDPIDALAVASLGESVVCLDEFDQVLAPSMVTGDSRGIQETQWLIEQVGAQHILDITGLPPNALYTLPKFIWMHHNTDTLQKASKIFFYEDYIGYLLTGKQMVSYSSACRSMAFDIRRKDWSQELLDLAGVQVEALSRPVEAGTVIGTILPEMAQRLLLNPNLVVVAGGHDQSCAALGSGLKDIQGAETSMGTCEFMLFMLPEPRFDPYMIENDFACIPYVLPGSYLTSLEVTTCGILKNWGKQVLFSQMVQGKSNSIFFQELEQRIVGLRTNVLALPQFGSSGNPDLSMEAYGTITGLTVHTQAEEIYLALLEGMSFQLLLAYERLLTLRTAPEYIVATGGGAASDTTLQIRANVFNMRVLRLESEETGTLGCMILAASGTGAYKSLEEGIERAVRVVKTFEPNKVDVAYYSAKFQKYKKLYSLMHDFQ